MTLLEVGSSALAQPTASLTKAIVRACHAEFVKYGGRRG